jgi:hypothetical protein
MHVQGSVHLDDELSNAEVTRDHVGESRLLGGVPVLIVKVVHEEVTKG